MDSMRAHTNGIQGLAGSSLDRVTSKKHSPESKIQRVNLTGGWQGKGQATRLMVTDKCDQGRPSVEHEDLSSAAVAAKVYGVNQLWGKQGRGGNTVMRKLGEM